MCHVKYPASLPVVNMRVVFSATISLPASEKGKAIYILLVAPTHYRFHTFSCYALYTGYIKHGYNVYKWKMCAQASAMYVQCWKAVIRVLYNAPENTRD